MRFLFTSRNVAEINLLRGLLEADGIACQTRNEYNSTISLALEFMPELYVEREDDFKAAQQILARYQTPVDTKLEDWRCPRCGEINEAQFGACWKCGHWIDEEYPME